MRIGICTEHIPLQTEHTQTRCISIDCNIDEFSVAYQSQINLFIMTYVPITRNFVNGLHTMDKNPEAKTFVECTYISKPGSLPLYQKIVNIGHTRALAVR